MRHLPNYALLAIFATGCMAAEDQIDLGSARAPILGGTAATVGQYPTVVAILNAGLCTGTLVAPDLVLTAAHCVNPQILGYSSQAQVTAATSVVVDTTNVSDYSMGRTIAAADTIPNPGFGGEQDLGHDDIALIRLSQSVTDRTPTKINRVAADAPIGVTTTLVGYGMTDPQSQYSAGKLYVLASKNSVSCSSWLGSNSLLLCYDQTDGTGSCSGDSGGPAFITVNGELEVAGVTSFGDQTCASDGAYTRVDAELDFLDAQAPELACAADGVCTEECGQNGLPDDPDCPNCETSDDCDDPDQQECIDGFCFARPNTPGGLGYECVGNDDCDSGLCGSDGVDHLCSDICDPAASDCPDGFECLAAGDNGACWPSADGGGGGCATGSGSTPAAALLVLLLVATVGRRRRTTARG